jgi:lysophospholipase L1-like esterase
VQHILVYGDSLSWGIIPGTRQRLAFEQRWPGVMELALRATGHEVRVIEDCLNGRRTVWDDPFKPGRNGLTGLAQRIEINSPLALVMIVLGSNDFQCMHDNTPFLSSQGLATLVNAIRQAPVEPGMAIPPIAIVAPPAIMHPQGPIAAKFEGAAAKSKGLAQAYESLAQQLDCLFFDANTVTPASKVDGIHLDADQHALLGKALADWFVAWSVRTSPG